MKILPWVLFYVSLHFFETPSFLLLKTYIMKRLLFPALTFLFVLLCQQDFGQMAAPYKANYSSDFKIGDAKNSKIILDLWKDWDDNAFDRHDYMADTIVMFFPDGSMVRGKDSAIAGAKRFRGSMSGATSSIDAWVPLKSNDRNENWVAIWGMETDTYSDGKTQKRDLHEIWRINKDGKVDFMKQFASAPAAGQ